jgi:hypothetical protein
VANVQPIAFHGWLFEIVICQNLNVPTMKLCFYSGLVDRMSVSHCRTKPRHEIAANSSNRVILFDENPISISALPPTNTKRWTSRRKAAVIAGVCGGLITLEEAHKRYCISKEEFLSWQHLIDNHGIRGLRVTKLHDYRETVRESQLTDVA